MKRSLRIAFGAACECDALCAIGLTTESVKPHLELDGEKVSYGVEFSFSDREREEIRAFIERHRRLGHTVQAVLFKVGRSVTGGERETFVSHAVRKNEEPRS